MPSLYVGKHLKNQVQDLAEELSDPPEKVVSETDALERMLDDEHQSALEQRRNN